MLNSIIVDDEIDSQIALKHLIENYCGNSIHVIRTNESVAEAVKTITEHKPDLVFLDVEMPGESGFELFNYFKNPDFECIFTTAHDKYAVRAFRHAALDYLLKPVDVMELCEAVQRVKKRKDKNNLAEKIASLTEHITGTNSKKIVLPTSSGTYIEDPENIIFCTADVNYTIIKLNSGKEIIVSKTLKKVQDLLNPSQFIRIHKSHLVNIKYITLFKKTTNKILLEDGTELGVSGRKINELFEYLKS